LHLAPPRDDLADPQQPERAGSGAGRAASLVPPPAAPPRRPRRASEGERREALGERALELALVVLPRLLIERTRVGVADLLERVLHDIDRVHVVAVQLLRLVAVARVVRVEPRLRLRDVAGVLALEEVELAGDQVAKARPSQH